MAGGPGQGVGAAVRPEGGIGPASPGQDERPGLDRPAVGCGRARGLCAPDDGNGLESRDDAHPPAADLHFQDLKHRGGLIGRRVETVSVGHDPEAEPFEKRDDLPGSETGQDRGDEAGVRRMKEARIQALVAEVAPSSARDQDLFSQAGHPVDDRDRAAFPGGGDRRRQAGRPPADNGDIKGRAHAASILHSTGFAKPGRRFVKATGSRGPASRKRTSKAGHDHAAETDGPPAQPDGSYVRLLSEPGRRPE